MFERSIMTVVVSACIGITIWSLVQTWFKQRPILSGRPRYHKLGLLLHIIGLVMMIGGLVVMVNDMFFSTESVTYAALMGQTSFLVGLLFAMFAHLNARIDRLYKK
jgi:hypothetical protein